MLHGLFSTSYKHLQNVNAEINVEYFLPLSQILISLRSHEDPTKTLCVMIQQKYDNDLVTFFCMIDVSQEVSSLLPILPLLLDHILGMKVDNFFRSTYTIGTEGYQ